VPNPPPTSEVATFQVCRRDLQNGARENVAQEMHTLAADMERKPAAFGVERSHRSARLHVVRRHPRIDDPDLDDMRGPG